MTAIRHRVTALLTGGRSSYPPVLACTVPTFGVVSVSVYVINSVLLCYIGLPAARHVLSGTMIIKMMCVHKLYLQG